MAKARQTQNELPATLRDFERRLQSLESKIVRPAAAREAYRVLSRGMVRQQTLTTDGSAFTTSTASDFALSNVPVEAGRLYGVHVHSRYEFSSVAAAARWVVRLRINGTNTHVLLDFLPVQTGVILNTIDAWAFWAPSVTAETDDLDVFADEIADGATFQFNAASTSPRTMTLFDLGVTA